jgi:hypothetical protein
MKEKSYKRAHVRAPLKSQAICCLEDKIFLGRTLNISQGGLLLTDLESVSQNKSLHLMIDLPSYPNFNDFKKEELLNLDWNSFERYVLRIEMNVMRSFKVGKEGEEIELHGCSFVSIVEDHVNLIKRYVESFTKNIIYLLDIFESLGREDVSLSILRKVSFLLGYNPEEKIFSLRKKILHDYQSLETL